MTENERLTINGKEVTLYREVETNLYRFSKDAVDMLLKALEEKEQYRAIGTVEEFKAYKLGDCMNHCEHYDNCSNYIYSKGYNKAIDEFVKKICEKYTDEESKGNFKQYCVNIKQNIADIAEQLKGENNGQRKSS